MLHIRVQKKFIAVTLSILLSSTVASNKIYAQEAPTCGSGTYVISAYYSPVPGQSRYATGTYEGDIRLNGGGVTTASGVKVEAAQTPFVAAPKCMPFGTVLEIENLGSHVVLDRGGAIKGNRLDIWMGYGDVGLKNALTWGKRSVYVGVAGTSAVAPSIGFTYDIGKKSLKSYQVTEAQDPLKFVRELAFGDTGEDVARLQQILKDLGYYKAQVNGTYDNITKLAVESFNKDSGVIADSDVENRGRFGSTSVAELKTAVISNREKYLKDAPSRSLGRGSKGEDVKKLQEFLVGLGFMESVTGIYDSTTVDAVLAFQLAEKIITSPTDQGAGYFGPNTQLAYDRIVLGLENSIASKPSSAEEFESVALTSLSASEMITDALEEGDTGEQVRRLQQTLRDLNFLTIEPSGYYGPVTTHAVFKFQQRMGIINDKSDLAAGVVGPETRLALNKYLNSRNQLLTELKDSSEAVSIVDLQSEEPKHSFDTDLDLNVAHPDVAKLQDFLKNKGYFTGQLITDYFGPVTKSALIKFKQDYELDLNSNVLLDSKTRELINTLI